VGASCSGVSACRLVNGSVYLWTLRRSSRGKRPEPSAAGVTAFPDLAEPAARGRSRHGAGQVVDASTTKTFTGQAGTVLRSPPLASMTVPLM
jgi:hypothetical protein